MDTRGISTKGEVEENETEKKKKKVEYSQNKFLWSNDVLSVENKNKATPMKKTYICYTNPPARKKKPPCKQKHPPNPPTRSSPRVRPQISHLAIPQRAALAQNRRNRAFFAQDGRHGAMVGVGVVVVVLGLGLVGGSGAAGVGGGSWVVAVVAVGRAGWVGGVLGVGYVGGGSVGKRGVGGWVWG